MKRAVKVFLIVLALAFVAIVLAVPFVVPTIACQIAEDKLAEYGLVSDIRLRLGYCWRNGPGIEGALNVALIGTPWRVSAEFGASCCEWSAHVSIPETHFSERDPLLQKLLAQKEFSGVSNLVFSGSVSVEAHAERTYSRPVVEWRAKAPVRGLNVGFEREGRPFFVQGVSLTPSAYGLADHVDIHPVFVKADGLVAAGVALTNLHASVRMAERALIVSEATAGFCGGKVSVYSFYLDPKNAHVGLTLFLDEIDAGEALRHVNGFRGDASGRLHGKMRVIMREGGCALRLSDAFLYSTPGETGKLRLRDKRLFAENLAYAGLDEPTRENVAEALSDLDYRVLRMDLRRIEGETARLIVRIAGTAIRGDTSVPVDVTVNLNGEIEQLINTGLGLSAKMKENKR